MAVKKILIVKTTSMGDVIHALPAVHDIASALPGVQIDWVVEKSFSDIPRLSQHVTCVHEVAVRQWRKQLFNRQTWQDIAKVKAALAGQNYDLVIDLQGLLKSALVAKWACSPIVGYDAQSIKEPVASRFYDQKFSISKSMLAMTRCRALAAAALGYNYQTLPLSFGMKDLQGSDGKKPYAVFLVNTSRETKLWDEARWVEMAQNVHKEGLNVRFLWGAPEEHERVRRIAQQAGDFCEVMPRMPIGECARCIQGAEFAVGVDTGLTHLAAATAVPTVGLFLDFPIELVGLSGEHVISLGGVGANPTVSEVYEALQKVRDANIA